MKPSYAHFRLRSVQALPGQILRLVFADGERAEVALSRVIASHPALADLGKPALFRRAAIGPGGRTVTWGKDELELAGDNLRAEVVEQAGGYSHERIWNWMDRHSLSLDAAADALGISRRMIAYYRSGKKPIPKAVWLAMKGWEAVHRRAA